MPVLAGTGAGGGAMSPHVMVQLCEGGTQLCTCVRTRTIPMLLGVGLGDDGIMVALLLSVRAVNECDDACARHQIPALRVLHRPAPGGGGHKAGVWWAGEGVCVHPRHVATRSWLLHDTDADTHTQVAFTAHRHARRTRRLSSSSVKNSESSAPRFLSARGVAGS